MAYSKHRSQRDDMLACSVCFEYYVEPYIPKNLECGHVCCQECLKHMITKSKKGNVLCPECRCKMRIPGGNIENLPTNFPLKSLAEHEQKQSRTSPVVRRTTLRRRVTMLKKRESYVVQREKKDTGQDNEDITSQEEELATLRLKIECLEQQLQQQQEPFPNEPVYTQLDFPQDDETTQQQGHLQQGSENTEQLIPPSHPPLPSAPPLVPSASPPPLPDRPARLSLPGQIHLTTLQYSSTLPPQNVSPLEMGRHFPSAMTEQVLPMESRLSLPGNMLHHGQLQQGQLEHGPAQQAASQILRKHLQPTEEFGNFEQAQGIAVTPDGLLAVCDFKGEVVTVFHRSIKKGKVQRKFNLALYAKNKNRPADIATTTKGGFLVARRTGVELYSSKGKYERTLPNAIQDTVGVCSVATAMDGRILVGDISNYTIVIYNSKGDAIFQTISTATKPARIAALEGHFVAVSHARFGRLEVFDTSLGKSVNVINIPEALGMCYDPHTNCILVVRNTRLEPGSVQSSTGVVEQYNATTGELKACLAEKLFHPFNLAFTANGMLAVADKTTIKLFNVREGQPIYE